MGRLPDQFASTPVVRRRMQAIRSTDTQPELRLRRSLHACGLRYRIHVRPLSGLNRKADIVFTRARVAVFCDGCFWHGCPEHGRRRHEVNSWYWPEKIARNIDRDQDTNKKLTEAGWTVIRVWEHEDVESATERIVTVVRDQGTPTR